MAITNNLGQTKVGVRNVSGYQQVSYLLDTYSGAAAAYSLRKLNGSYTGSAIRVRRSSDNTTLDVGFDANGNLDTTSMLNFIGGQNLYLPSEDLSGFNWGGNGVNKTSNTGVAPDGITPANLLSEQSTLNNHNLSYSVGLSITAGKAVNHSVYLKKGPGSNAPDIISLYVGNATFNMRAVFNISTGQLLNTTTGNATGFEALITDAGNGWWRCSIGGTLPHTTTQNFLLLTEFCNNVNSTTRQFYLGNVNANVYVWGLQYSNTNSVQPYSKTTTLTAGNGFISIWYDQSGNGRNATQEASANQPQIINNGVVYTLNSKPTIYFIGNQWLTTTQTVVNTGNSTYSIFGVGKHTSTSSRTLFFIGTAYSGQGIGLNLHNSSIPRHYWFSNDFDSTQSFYNITSLFTISYDGTKRYTTINNVEQSSNSTGKATLNPILTIGRLTNNAQYMIGYESELFIYNSNKENDKTNIATSINTYYSIY
jgi:hypothetical protein